jgi:hypothetical protein
VTLAIDGTAFDHFTGVSSGFLTLTTTLGGDNIIIAIMAKTTSGTGSASVLAIYGEGLTFTRRGFEFIDPFNSEACTFEYWVARAPSALSSGVFTIILSQPAIVCAMAAFAVHSPNLISPFETQFGGLPIVSSNATGAGNPPIAGQLNTFGINDLVFGIRFTSVSGVTGGVPGDGGVLGFFNSVVSCDVSGTEAHIFVEDIIVPDAGVQVVVYEDTNRDYWVMFADAFVEEQGEDLTIYPSPNQIDPENLFVAVEIDVYDRYNLETKKLQIVNRGPFFDGDGNQFYLGLGLPISLGIRISADVYGQILRGTTEGGDINFEIVGIEEWFDTRRFHWINSEFRVYTGYSLEGLLSDLSLVYTGLVSDMTHNFYVATLKTTDKSNLINKPLLTTVYNDTFPSAIQGKVKPKLFGKVFNLEPVLEDEVNLIYRVTVVPVSGDALDDVTRLSVGGVNWDKVGGTPGAGQWSVDLVNGTVQLGSVTLGGEVRCDAQVPGYATFYTGDLLQEVVELAGGSVDGDSAKYFTASQNDRVGFYTGTESLNVQDVLDTITQRQGGFWTCSVSGDILYKPLTYPSGPFTIGMQNLYLSQVEIKDIVQSKLIPAVWRVRVEYAPNWSPVTQFFEGVTDEEKAQQSVLGITHDSVNGLFDTQVKDLDPAAGDIYIRTLCWEAAPAYSIGSRLFGGWRFERRLFDIKAYCDPSLVEIYTGVNMKYGFMNLGGFAHRAVMVIGGGPNEFQVWG